MIDDKRLQEIRELVEWMKGDCEADREVTDALIHLLAEIDRLKSAAPKTTPACVADVDCNPKQ